MKRKLNSDKTKNKLTLDKQTIRELEPIELEDNTGAVQQIAARRKFDDC
jgi:hypothetical protein